MIANRALPRGSDSDICKPCRDGFRKGYCMLTEQKSFFGEEVLLSTPEASRLYANVRALPIVDYHCHLNEREIAENRAFPDLGELWLGGDHYKWRAMRLCGVEERYITGNADYHEKYLRYAEIFPQLCGNPLYYWTQMELSLLFGIHLPLGPDTAEEIWDTANRALAGMRVRDILTRFRVRYIATTDDPVSPLNWHGVYGDTTVAPTFRPDRMLSLDADALTELAAAADTDTGSLEGFKLALSRRLDYFVAHGCRISDHGMDFLPAEDCGGRRAAELYARRDTLTADERGELFSHLLAFLADAYTARDMVMQLHFGTYRNVNTAAFSRVGRDAGYDIMRGQTDTDRLVRFLDGLDARGAMPRTVLYSLNPTCVPALATLTGAFPRARVGAAWWFNDSLAGIRRQLETVSEYALLGTSLGMLTDSRSFASYARFDFFRRILADTVGGMVARGEYAPAHADRLMQDICYGNAVDFLRLQLQLQ